MFVDQTNHTVILFLYEKWCENVLKSDINDLYFAMIKLLEHVYIMTTLWKDVEDKYTTVSRKNVTNVAFYKPVSL